MVRVEGGVTAPKGFLAAGVRCAIKEQGKDLALVVSQTPAVCAAMFTTNAFKAAPVLLSMKHAASGNPVRAIVANSGSANACTGEQGARDAERMAAIAAEALNVESEQVIVCSTGVIGHFLPMGKIETGIKQASEVLSREGGTDAAQAIMTTDKCAKVAAYEFEIGGVPVRIGGIAKGSGMICPNLATMFCFLTTDVSIEPALLRECLQLSAEISFNSLTVDGDTSTNDSVVLLANGMAGNARIDSEGDDLEAFQEALDTVAIDLAKAIARDGEGATKLVEIVVQNAPSYSDAKLIAQTVANSPLVKTAIFGQDPNWGRVLAAAGRSGATIEPNKVDLFLGDTKIVEKGEPLRISEAVARAPMLEQELVVTLDLNAGDESARVFTCDFSYDYVKINAEYHT